MKLQHKKVTEKGMTHDYCISFESVDTPNMYELIKNTIFHLTLQYADIYQASIRNNSLLVRIETYPKEYIDDCGEFVDVEDSFEEHIFTIYDDNDNTISVDWDSYIPENFDIK